MDRANDFQVERVFFLEIPLNNMVKSLPHHEKDTIMHYWSSWKNGKKNRRVRRKRSPF